MQVGPYRFIIGVRQSLRRVSEPDRPDDKETRWDVVKKPKVYIDGKEGTTGLQIYQRLGEREDIELLLIIA